MAAEDRLRGAIIERLMCDLAVDLELVVAQYNADTRDFEPELARIDRLAADGLVTRDGTRITVPDEARPFLRNVCAIFDRHFSEAPRRHSRAV